MATLSIPVVRPVPAERIAAQAVRSLLLEIRTYPKPGLVSHVDRGSHRDMDRDLLFRSAEALRPGFAVLAAAGGADAPMDRLRRIGMDAEAAMLAVTGGVNTHRGAIFGLGLLVAAAGWRAANASLLSLGAIVESCWRAGIVNGPVPLDSHGTRAAHRFGAGGARAEAAAGFPSVYGIALPAFEAAKRAGGTAHDARVAACLALMARVEDTNLLHRGGLSGLAFAREIAGTVVTAGAVGSAAWRQRAIEAHRKFVGRGLSPGGCADLLGMALFVRQIEK